jgi:predicted O-linked N-acetylglucosamine transferase (SPINDLY family)
LTNAGFTQHQAGRLEQAEALYRKVLEKDPDHPEALHLLGLIAYQQEKFASAIALIQRALPELSDMPEVHLNLGNALREAGRLGDATGSYRRALAIDPDYGMAHSNLARTLNDQGLFEAGLESSRRAVELMPGFLGAQVNCAAALLGLERVAEAEAPLRRVVDLAPDRAEAHHDLGKILATLGRLDEAVASYHQALVINPDYAEAHYNLGRALSAQSHLDWAEASYRRTLALDPDHAHAHYGLANVFRTQRKLTEAIACFGRAVTLDSSDLVSLANWFRERQNICDWASYREDESRARSALKAQASPFAPSLLLALSSTPEEQLTCARRVSAKIAVPKATMLSRPQPRRDKRIRLGYLSSYFRRHPVAFPIAGLIEHHDRQRFDVAGYSTGPDDQDAMRARLIGAFDRFVDIDKTTEREAAELIHSDGIDILIDLDGYTGPSRTAIFAFRPAPVQVNYIGFPGTMGAEFIDYIIVDRFLVPPGQQDFFSERLVHLPHCYLCTDDRREIAERTPTRAECELPETGFVFCCFHTCYKITPTLFEIWLRLLKQVPGSVLWLLHANPWATANLKREATARGVAPERLVFAPLQPPSEHLARQRLADLYLDTLPYNANTTAIEALWVGLPLVTCAGKTFAGRMAGSAIQAIGLSKLITTSLKEYEALALRLATEPGRLARLRQKLARNRSTMPLFDTARFARNLEAAYRQMWEIWRAGRPPAPISVPSAGAVLSTPRPEHSEARPSQLIT